MAVHLIGSQPDALMDLPSDCSFRRVLRVRGAGAGRPEVAGPPRRRRAAALARLEQAVVHCPRRGLVSGGECAACAHLLAWRVAPDVLLRCGAGDEDPVREWMRTAPPATCVGTPCDAADADAARLGVHHLLVLDGARRLVGVVCRHDLARGGGGPVDAVMADEVFAVGPGARLGAAATAMRRLGIGCLPVVAGPLVVGLLTRGELARAGAP